jgi:hypothetical protein
MGNFGVPWARRSRLLDVPPRRDLRLRMRLDCCVAETMGGRILCSGFRVSSGCADFLQDPAQPRLFNIRGFGSPSAPFAPNPFNIRGFGSFSATYAPNPTCSGANRYTHGVRGFGEWTDVCAFEGCLHACGLAVFRGPTRHADATDRAARRKRHVGT